MSGKKTTRRRAVGKKLRFEVFKRDMFSCQYCGAAAPDVELQIDHIEPVARGGTNDLINLATSCVACNGGKGATPLSDHSAVSKQRGEATRIAQRREQLELMARWHRELAETNLDGVEVVSEHISECLGYTLTTHGRNAVRRLLREYGADEVCASVAISTKYLEEDGKGGWTSDSFERAFDALGGILHNRRNPPDENARARSYIAGIARNRLPHFNPRTLSSAVRDAQDVGVPFEALKEIACNARNWSELQTDIYTATIEYAEHGDES